jgi:cytochrome c-type protein NapB
MIKQSLITIATLALLNISALAADTNDTKVESNATKQADAKPAVEVNTAACAGCHGKDFEKKALNVSKIVKDMTKADIVASLKGYKEGKGGAMKAVMLGQVKALTDEQMTAIAEKFGK